jgi:hypothetical protein
VALDEQVSQLVDDDVVEDPSRIRGQPGGDANGPVVGRARTPSLAHVVAPANGLRARETVFTRQAASPAGDVDAGRIDSTPHAFGELFGGLLGFS